MGKIVFLFFVFFTSNWCHAFNENCTELSHQQAKSSLKIIHHQIINQSNQVFKDIPIIDYYCEQCRDQYVRPIVVESIDIKKVGTFWRLLINEKVQNIAYLYVDNTNIGHMVGCAPKAVSKKLNF